MSVGDILRRAQETQADIKKAEIEKQIKVLEERQARLERAKALYFDPATLGYRRVQ